MLRERHSRRQRLARRTGGYAMVAIAGVLLVAAVGLGLRALLSPEAPDGPATAADAASAPATDQRTLLLIGVGADGGPAQSLTLLAAAPGGGDVVFIPSSTLVELPGVGLDRLGLAQQYGGADLVMAGLSNALGIGVDHAAVVTTRRLGVLLQRVGGFTVDVAERLVERADDGTGSVAFEAGSQYLNGTELADYWAFRQRGESELEVFPRQQTVLRGLFEVLADDALRAQLVARRQATLDTDADNAFLEEVLGGLAGAAEDGTVGYHLLPVEPFGAGDEVRGGTYRLDPAEIDRFVGTVLAGSLPEGIMAPIRLQVLNGVGRPGVGRDVAEALDGLGFRIVLSENARSFDFATTQIIIYDETPASHTAAERVRHALGVGTILVSRQPQSVVDLTIVVGADLDAAAAQAPAPPPGR